MLRGPLVAVVPLTCQIDPSIERRASDGLQFPLGVYPVEDVDVRAGYAMHFEPADGDDDEGEWEEWPDRYVFEVVISAERLEPLVRSLLTLLPARVYPILEVIGNDAYREIDPYISYQLLGMDRLLDALTRLRGFFFEDGFCGFGALSDEPHFAYLFVDEHKVITVRCDPEHRDEVMQILAAFDLEPVDEPRGADAGAHEHRSVLLAPTPRKPGNGPATFDELVEALCDEWQLDLNIDADENKDDDGRDLGVTFWRCLARCAVDGQPSRYAESLVTAGSFREAARLAGEAADALKAPGVEAWDDVVLVQADRIRPEDAGELPGAKGRPPDWALKQGSRIWRQGWVE